MSLLARSSARLRFVSPYLRVRVPRLAAILRLALTTWVLAFGAAFPSLARAEAPNARATPVHVLGIDSDDVEEQADALTGALRSRVRAAPGWSLQETSHSLGMLTAALRCPSKPDEKCLQRIGDQIHTDRFVWGVMTRAGKNQVTAELHMWTRGKPDVSFKESYSDNLKDQNDETLRALATRIFERLSGSTSNGTVSVRAADESGPLATGAVFVDGQRRAPLEHGTATVDLPAGPHVVEVRAAGYSASKLPVTVIAGSDLEVPLKLTPVPLETKAKPEAEKGPSVRKIAGWSAVGVGGALLVVGVVEGVRFLGLKSDLDDQRSHVDKSVTDVCAPEQAGNPAAVQACGTYNDAKSARTLGLVLGGIGAAVTTTGVVLLLTDTSHAAPDEHATTARAGHIQVIPSISPAYKGLDVHVVF